MKRSRRSARTLRVASILVTACLAGSGALAHPASTTEVALTIRDAGFFEVAITIDPEALRAKVAAMQRPLPDLVEVRCDGARVPLTVVACAAAGCKSGPGVIALTGAIPPGASAITIGSSLVYGSYPLTIRGAGGGDPVVQWLQGPEASMPYALHAARDARARGRDILTYLSLGFTHILPHGFDHMLFVLGLFLLTRQTGSMLAQVGAFTLAHSITLGLSLSGIVSLPAAVVEPLIALSIAYVALENLVTADLKPWRLALVFAFGLLHGMRFAGAFAHDLPRPAFLAALVTFNVGVEIGQLAVIAAAALLLRALAIPAAQYRRRIVWPASAAIALTGMFWTIERLII